MNRISRSWEWGRWCGVCVCGGECVGVGGWVCVWVRVGGWGRVCVCVCGGVCVCVYEDCEGLYGLIS